MRLASRLSLAALAAALLLPAAASACEGHAKAAKVAAGSGSGCAAVTDGMKPCCAKAVRSVVAAAETGCAATTRARFASLDGDCCRKAASASLEACAGKKEGCSAAARAALASTGSSGCGSKAKAAKLASAGHAGCGSKAKEAKLASAGHAGCGSKAKATTLASGGCGSKAKDAKLASAGCCAKKGAASAPASLTADLDGCGLDQGRTRLVGTVHCARCDLGASEGCRTLLRTSSGCVVQLHDGPTAGELQREAGHGTKLVRVKGVVDEEGQLEVARYRVLRDVETPAVGL